MASSVPDASEYPLIRDGTVPDVYVIDARQDVVAIPEKCNLFIYHANCPDGRAAAWVARKKLGDQVKLVSVRHGSSGPPPDARGRHVVVCDFSFKEDVTLKMIKEAASFVILDHHDSAIADLKNIPKENKVFTTKMSGCTLAWCYFYPGEKVPLWLRYLEDKDIWRWNHPKSREFDAVANLRLKDIDAMDRLDKEGPAEIEKFIALGTQVYAHSQKIVNYHVSRARLCKLKKFPQYVAAIVNSTMSASDIGNAICTDVKGIDFSIVWQYDGIGRKFNVSLRSVSQDVDVSLIAKTFEDGGGHKLASAFRYTKTDFLDLFEFINKPKGSSNVGAPTALDANVPRGSALEEYNKDIIESHLKKAQLCKLKQAPQFVGAIVNSSVLGRESGNEICRSMNKADYAIVWSHDAMTGKYDVSLYSNTVDVSEIANKFGGSGDRCEATFTYKKQNILGILDFLSSPRGQQKNGQGRRPGPGRR